MSARILSRARFGLDNCVLELGELAPESEPDLKYDLAARLPAERIQMLLALWNDEDGVILSAEMVLIGTILVLGMIVGLVELQSAVVAELSDLGHSLGNLNQSYRTSGVASVNFSGGINGSTPGSAWLDGPGGGAGNIVITGDVTGQVGEQYANAATPFHSPISGPMVYHENLQPVPEVQEPTAPTYTEEELEELERIKMKRRVYERHKVREPDRGPDFESTIQPPSLESETQSAD